MILKTIVIREFEGQDEAVLLKYHQDAIEGKMRIKRKNIGIEDSESEDEEGSRPRKQYSKKRRIEGDTLEACGECTVPVDVSFRIKRNS